MDARADDSRARCLVGPLVAGAVVLLVLTAVWWIAPVRSIAVLVTKEADDLLVVAAMIALALHVYASWRGTARAGVSCGRGGPARRVRTGLIAGAAVSLFPLMCIETWVRLPAAPSFVAGLLPYSDGLDYLLGATRLLVTGQAQEWGSRRPLNAALFAVRLGLSGGDLRVALLLQATFVGASAWLLARAVARDLGSAAGLVVVAALALVARPWLGTTLSEPLGLAVGCLSGVLLWRGAQAGAIGIAAAGVGVAALAQQVRPGAAFVVPALVVWAAVAFRSGGARRSAGAAGLAVAAAAVAVLVSGAVRAWYGTGFGVGHGNFSMTLYALVTGEPGWQRLYEDFPETLRLSDAARNTFAYDQSWGALRRDPLLLVAGLGRAAVDAAGQVGRLLAAERRLAVPLVILTIGAVRFLLVHRGSRAGLLLAAVALGVLASMPIVVPDGGLRVLIASWPLLALFLAIGVEGGTKDAGAARPAPAAGASSPAAAGAGALTGLLVIAALVGPAIAHRLEPARLRADARGTDRSIVVRIGPRTPHVRILGADEDGTTFIPIVTAEDAARHFDHSPLPFWGARGGVEAGRPLEGPIVIVLGHTLDPRGLSYRWIIGPPAMIGAAPRALRLSGREVAEDWFRYFVVEDFEPMPAPPPAATP